MEQRVRPRRTALELGMELCSYKPGMVSQFDNLHKAIVGRSTTYNETVGLHPFAIIVIELKTMAMAFKNDRLIVCLMGFCTGGETTNPVAKTHCATFVSDLTLGVHEINDWMLSVWIKLGTIRIFQAEDVTRKLNDCHL